MHYLCNKGLSGAPNKLMDSIRKSTPAETNKQVDFCVAIANRVFDLMNEKGIKQRDLAKLLGKTETEVSRRLSGTHNLTIATIAKMAVVLDEIPTFLFIHIREECVPSLRVVGVIYRQWRIEPVAAMIDVVNDYAAL